MAKDSPQPRRSERNVWELPPQGVPLPTLRFRRHAWLAFQRALDPLARPKPVPTKARREPTRRGSG